MKQVLVSFVICCCLNFTIQAQETVVIGTVLNADQQPIEDASVQLGQFFSSTDRRGQFKIIANYLPVQLLINHPFYELYEQIVLQQTGKDTIFLPITLITEQTNLKEWPETPTKLCGLIPKNRFTSLISICAITGCCCSVLLRNSVFCAWSTITTKHCLINPSEKIRYPFFTIV